MSRASRISENDEWNDEQDIGHDASLNSGLDTFLGRDDSQLRRPRTRSEELTIDDSLMFASVAEDQPADAFRLLQGSQFESDDGVFEEDSEDPRFSESFNFSDNSVSSPEDAEPLKYHPAGYDDDDAESAADELTPSSKAKSRWGLLGAAVVATAVVGQRIISTLASGDDVDVDDSGVLQHATGKEAALPGAPPGDGGGGTMAGADGGAITGGPMLHSGAVPSDGGTLAGIPSAQPGIPPSDGGVLSGVPGAQPMIPPGDGGAAFVDPGGVCFTPLHTTAATGAPTPITLMPPPDPMQ